MCFPIRLQLKKAKKGKKRKGVKESPKEAALEKLAVDPEVSPTLQAAAELAVHQHHSGCGTVRKSSCGSAKLLRMYPGEAVCIPTRYHWGLFT